MVSAGALAGALALAIPANTVITPFADGPGLLCAIGEHHLAFETKGDDVRFCPDWMPSQRAPGECYQRNGRIAGRFALWPGEDRLVIVFTEGAGTFVSNDALYVLVVGARGGEASLMRTVGAFGRHPRDFAGNVVTAAGPVTFTALGECHVAP